jgi:hypothetical protein
MKVSHRLTYKFDVSARELKLIRRALELEGPNGSELARQMTEQVKRSTEDLRTHFETLLEVIRKEPDANE